MPVVCRFAVESMVFQNHSSKSAQRLDGDVLKDSILHKLQKVLVKRVVVEAIERGEQLSAIRSCNFGSLHLVIITKIREQQDEERVDHKSLVAIPDSLKVDGLLVEAEGQKGDDRVDRNHKHNPHYVAYREKIDKSMLLMLTQALNEMSRWSKESLTLLRGLRH